MTILAAHNWPSNAELIADVAKLGYLDGTVLDATYGRGGFWRAWRPATLIAHDLITDGVDFRALPEAAGSVDVLVLDPPYKLNGTPALGDFDNRYGVDVVATWRDRHALIRDGILEAYRVVRPRGYLLLKCQDQVCSGRVRWQTLEFSNYAAGLGFALVDRFDLLGKSRPQPGNRPQRHAHGRPSTLLIFQKLVLDSSGAPA